MKRLSLRERFESFVMPEPNTGCFLFCGQWNKWGHGRFWLDGGNRQAHRVAWLLAGNTLAATDCVLHRCDVPCCVNVDHLYVGSFADNMLDMAMKRRGRTSKAGMPYGVFPSRSGKRFNVRVGTAKIPPRYLGSYESLEVAAAVAEAARKEMYGK